MLDCFMIITGVWWQCWCVLKEGGGWGGWIKVVLPCQVPYRHCKDMVLWQYGLSVLCLIHHLLLPLRQHEGGWVVCVFVKGKMITTISNSLMLMMLLCIYNDYMYVISIYLILSFDTKPIGDKIYKCLLKVSSRVIGWWVFDAPPTERLLDRLTLIWHIGYSTD